RREFENGLAPGGGRLLAQYLTRAVSPARWTIELGTNQNNVTAPCSVGTWNSIVQNSCLIVDVDASPRPTGTSMFPTLTATIAGANSDEVLLTGHATALVAGQIEFVATRQAGCNGFIAPADCDHAGTVLQFTYHGLLNSQGQPQPL